MAMYQLLFNNIGLICLRIFSKVINIYLDFTLSIWDSLKNKMLQSKDKINNFKIDTYFQKDF